MKFVVIFGPPAVGKMTVGYELAKLTGFRLFHNHMTIELVLNFFDYEQPQFHALVAEFRKRIFEEVAASDLTGLIFAFVWALELESERAYIERICRIFREKGADVYFVELEAELAGKAEPQQVSLQAFAKTVQTKFRTIRETPIRQQ